MAAPQNCPRCGALVAGPARSCAKCGAPLGDLQEAPTTTAKGSDDVTQLAYMPPELLDSDRTVPVGPLPKPIALSLGPVPQVPAKSTEAKTQPFNAALIEALALRPAAETVPLGKLPPPVPSALMPKVPTGERTPLMPNPVMMMTPPMGEPVGDRLQNMDTSLIPGRLVARANAEAVRGSGLQSASESPTQRGLPEVPADRAPQEEQPPWLHPWVLAVGAMVLLALGLLIGLLVL
jgi:hypothetical protein